eukprot:m.120265 g.120265  ORF g.120265 m.120265 type:complete len:180 (+) comp17243_c2_seq36:1880-2419(+)
MWPQDSSARIRQSTSLHRACFSTDSTFLLSGAHVPLLTHSTLASLPCAYRGRSTVSKIFGPSKYGESLCAVATLQQLAQTVAVIVFPHLYSSVLSMDTTVHGIIQDNFGPRLVFGLIPACGALLALLAAFSLPTLNHLGEISLATGTRPAGAPLVEGSVLGGSVQHVAVEQRALLQHEE